MFFFFDQWQASAMMPLIKKNLVQRMTFTTRKCIKVNALSSIALGLGFYSSFIS